MPPHPGQRKRLRPGQGEFATALAHGVRASLTHSRCCSPSLSTFASSGPSARLPTSSRARRRRSICSARARRRRSAGKLGGWGRGQGAGAARPAPGRHVQPTAPQRGWPPAQGQFVQLIFAQAVRASTPASAKLPLARLPSSVVATCTAPPLSDCAAASAARKPKLRCQRGQQQQGGQQAHHGQRPGPTTTRLGRHSRRGSRFRGRQAGWRRSARWVKRGGMADVRTRLAWLANVWLLTKPLASLRGLPETVAQPERRHSARRMPCNMFTNARKPAGNNLRLG